MTANRATRRELRAVATRPPARTVEVTLSGGFDGWWAKARADFPARLLAELTSGDINRILGMLEAVVVEHNLPNTDGELAASLGDVDPYDGLMKIAEALFDELGRLPPR